MSRSKEIPIPKGSDKLFNGSSIVENGVHIFLGTDSARKRDERFGIAVLVGNDSTQDKEVWASSPRAAVRRLPPELQVVFVNVVRSRIK